MENFSVVARWQERPLAAPEVLKAHQEHSQRIKDKQAEINRVVERANQQLLREARIHAGDYLAAAAVQHEWSELFKGAKPIGTDPATVGERMARIIEAEDFTRGNALKQTTGYGEGIGVIYNKGELPQRRRYDVPIEQAECSRSNCGTPRPPRGPSNC